MSGEALTPDARGELGLTNARGLGLARVPIRSRELAVTLSGWRLYLIAEEGEGSITLIEMPESGSLYRGDGVCLGWPQERLAVGYEALVPRDEAALPDLPQLG